MVKLYSKTWHRNPYLALICYIRDIFIYAIPFKMPSLVIKCLYGINSDFVFLVHPRRSEDVFRALPFFTPLRKFISKKTIIKIFNFCPPVVIATIKTPAGINGIVISSFYLPEMLLRKNKVTLKEARRCIKLSSKIVKNYSYVGLGALWPIVTMRGIGIKKYATRMKVSITNGHTGTLVSLALMIDKLAELSGIKKANLKIIIIGAGKMGANLSNVLVDNAGCLGLVDINQKRLDVLETELRKKNKNIPIERILRLENTNMKTFLNKYHFGICVTSNARRILRIEDLPDDFLVIDDSRPEAISRENLPANKIILEGGFIKIKNLTTDYDYGFGIDDNVFGCLAETYVLALDREKTLKPTIGNVESNNYYNMYDYFKKANLCLGDFKSGDNFISDSRIKQLLNTRNDIKYIK